MVLIFNKITLRCRHKHKHSSSIAKRSSSPHGVVLIKNRMLQSTKDKTDPTEQRCNKQTITAQQQTLMLHRILNHSIIDDRTYNQRKPTKSNNQQAQSSYCPTLLFLRMDLHVHWGVNDTQKNKCCVGTQPKVQPTKTNEQATNKKQSIFFFQVDLRSPYCHFISQASQQYSFLTRRNNSHF